MLLLIATAFVLFLIFELISHLREQSWGWRASIMMTGLAWGAVLVLLTELLSVNHRLETLSLLISWTIVFLLLIGLLAWLAHRAKLQLPDVPQLRARMHQWTSEQDGVTWIMLAILGIQALLLGLVALSYAPNTYESMTYHLPRVMHWLQNGSLANFATTNVRDVYFPPFTEFVFLHQFALTGSDVYLNLVQLCAFLLCLIGVSAIAAELGTDRSTQIAAAVLAAGIPLAVLQATAARNDLVLALWLISLIWFGLRWSREPASWVWAAGTGVSLGLAVLTKASSFVYALPIGMLIGILVIKNGSWRPGMLQGGFILLLALMLNLGHFGRNLEFYMDPAGIHQRVKNDFMSPAVFASNTIRNVAMHVPTDCKPPLRILNQPGRWLLTGLGHLHALTGMSPTDAGTTWGYVDIFNRSLGCLYDEHFTGNGLHMLLILGTCVTLLYSRSINPLAKWLALSLVFGFLLLNLTLRWQVWGTHLQLPLFVLWTPVVAVALSQVRRPELSRMMALLAVSLSFLWIYHNQMRPLSGLISGSVPSRDEQYFQYARAYYSDFNSMTELISGTKCDRVGLNISSLALEYPIWVMLREKGFNGVIHHIDVTNETHIFEETAFVPCAIISEGSNSSYATLMTEQAFGSFYVYLDRQKAGSVP